MAAAVVQHRSVYTGNSLAYSTAPTAGNLLIVWGTGSSLPTTVTDSNGNTWASVTQTFNGTRAILAYCFNCKGGATTVTMNGSVGDPGISIYEVSGIQTASDPLDFAVAFTNPADSTTPTTNSFTLSTTCFVFVGIADETDAKSSLTAGTGYTLGEQQLSHFHGDEYSTSDKAAGTYTASFTLGNAGGANACMLAVAAFRIAGGGGGGGTAVPVFLHHLRQQGIA